MFFGLTWSCTVTPSASKLTNASPHEKGQSTMLKTAEIQRVQSSFQYQRLAHVYSSADSKVTGNIVMQETN